MPDVRTGVDLIAEERLRQKELGYDAAHDDARCEGELADAAAVFCAPDTDSRQLCWPFEDKGRPEVVGGTDVPDRIDQLAKAGALCAAEIDRLLRIPRVR